MSGDDLHVGEVGETVDDDTETVELTLERSGQADVISLTYGKDVDWSILKKIEAYLHPGAVGRFGAIFDGNALVTYAPPAQMRELGTIIGLDFYQ